MSSSVPFFASEIPAPDWGAFEAEYCEWLELVSGVSDPRSGGQVAPAVFEGSAELSQARALAEFYGGAALLMVAVRRVESAGFYAATAGSWARVAFELEAAAGGLL